jgi:NitT/TauT family transport system permease protein
MNRALIWSSACVLIAISWQAASHSSQLVRLFFSSPSALIAYVPEHAGFLASSSLVTATEAVCGLALALLIALSTGILVTLDQRAINWVLPPMILSQVVPLITIAPLLIVIFGIGLESKILMAAIISFFPIFINFVVSVRDTPAGLVDMMTLYRPPRLFRVVQVYLPLSLPALMGALRIAATLAVIGAIVAEFTGADSGLGKNLFLATRRLEPELMMTSVILAALLGGSLYLVIVAVERLTGRWYLR